LKASLLIALVALQLCGTGMTGTSEDESSKFVSIGELLSSCGMPRPCQVVAACEGKTVRAKGYIDYDNIFDRQNYPRLPYEKFTIRDGRGHSLEVWAVSKDNREVFGKINRHKAFPEAMAYIEGEIVGFDMPAMGKCERGIKLTIAGADKIFFK
jgi:hypothetical protein